MNDYDSTARTRTRTRTTEEDTDAARLGSRVAQRWTLEAFLGRGGMGTVYRAKSADGGAVALKILHVHGATNTTLLARLEREARLANAIDHPAVVPVLEHGVTDDGAPFLVTELVEGETLEELRLERGGVLPLEEVLAVAETLFEVLDVAHRKGIVHRDIKPSNLMFGSSGELRVLDFGLAREVNAGGQSASSVHAVVGTVGFMAPEQAQGRSDLVDARTDIWAAAATLLKLAAGIDVHEGATAQTRLALAATAPPPPLDARCDLPRHVVVALQRALSFSRADRFPDATSFRQALRGLVRTATANEGASPSRPRSDVVGPRHAWFGFLRPKARGAWWWAGAAALVTIVIGLAVVGGARPSAPRDAPLEPPERPGSSPTGPSVNAASSSVPPLSTIEPLGAASAPATTGRQSRPAHPAPPPSPRPVGGERPASTPPTHAEGASEGVPTASPEPATPPEAKPSNLDSVLDRRR